MSVENNLLFDSNQEIITYLKKARIFEGFSDSFLNKLIPLAKFSEYPQNAVILKEGDINTRLYFLIRGEVSVYAQNALILTLRRVGDIFGEMSIINHKPCSASIMAATRIVKVFSISSKEVGEYSDIYSDDLQNFLYHLFAKILTEKLSLTTHKAKLYESTNARLLDTQVVLENTIEELGEQIRTMNKFSRVEGIFTKKSEVQSLVNTLIKDLKHLESTSLQQEQKAKVSSLIYAGNTLLKSVNEILDISEKTLSQTPIIKPRGKATPKNSVVPDALKYIAVVNQELDEIIYEVLEIKYKEAQKINAALKQEDFATIRNLVYRIKGAHGLKFINELGAELEKAVDLKNVSKLQDLINELIDYLENVEIHFH
ncbi:cyclic nucleotide-binding domain-containing protein [Deltaproteobacteria bacterium TL4]